MNTTITRLSWNLRVCTRLLQRDLFVFKEIVPHRIVNSGIWTLLIVYIFEYVGLSTAVGWGAFIACGECATWGFTGMFGNLVRFMCDMKGQRTIFYHLSLPVPQWMVLATFCVSQTLQLMAIGATVFPLAALVLGSRFPFETFSFIKFVCIFICAYFFYGTLTLFYATLINSTEEMHTLRVRFRDTLFWVGAYLFTWQRLYDKNHVLAYLDLLNPLVYACEGMRAAALGQESSLSFWGCCAALLGFTALVGTLAVRRMMKKLDCVA